MSFSHVLVFCEAYSSDADSIFNRTVQIYKELGYHAESIDGSVRRIRASTSASLFSFGEDIEIIISHQEGNQATVNVNVKSKVWFNITSDTRSPVERIFEKLDSIFERV
ncbi:MAG: hypothetical protein QXX08_05420 [Candidatus Bathyarchaeia archaeon]